MFKLFYEPIFHSAVSHLSSFAILRENKQKKYQRTKTPTTKKMVLYFYIKGTSNVWKKITFFKRRISIKL